MLENFKIDKIGNFKNIHFVGIGGISMSGIAEILHHCNFVVTGSDANKSEIIENLISHGIPVSIGSNLSFVRNADIVVYTAAIQQTDPELLEAHRLNIPTMERSEFLGYITKTFSNTICVSGTHGKTTTTSMISLCFIEANLDPTIQVGANLKQINGNYQIGKSDYFIIEACEYVESFLKFFPKSEVILNIDNDHLDYFKNIGNVKNAFIKFVKLLPQDGFLVFNADDISCTNLPSFTSAKAISFGLNNSSANFMAKDISFDDNGFAEFDVTYNSEFYYHFKLSVPGIHNVTNALACISLCHLYGVSKNDMSVALSKFTGANRRFEFIGKYGNVSVYDDYAHHPTEIKATAKALNCKKFHESWAIFQPHTYSRTINLLEDFVDALSNFDHIIITDIYAAREVNVYNISPQSIVDKLCKIGKDCVYISDFEKIADFIHKNVYKDDIILTVGAGPVVKVAHLIVEK